MKTLPLLVPCLAFVAVANGQAAFDFESGTASDNQFTHHFRIVRNAAYMDQTNPVAGEPKNDYLYARKTAESNASSSVVAIYDMTPAQATDATQTFSGPFTINIKISTSSYNSGVGIYLFDSSNESRNLFARFYFHDAPNGKNRIILSKDAVMSTGAGGTRYTPATGVYGIGGDWHATSSSYRARTAAGISDEANPEWHTLTLSYSPGSNNDTRLTLAYGTSYTATVVLTNEDRIIDPGLGLYINHPDRTSGSRTKVDDIVITTIPDPSNYALLLSSL